MLLQVRFEKQSIFFKRCAMSRGGKRPGAGRKQGIPNRMTVTTREALWAYIESQTTLEQDANPFRRLVSRMLHTMDEQIEVRCAVELADRLLPKLKAVEHTGKDGGPLEVTGLAGLLTHARRGSDAQD
jgi:hypothetical protein